jgi:hypothetical protein
MWVINNSKKGRVGQMGAQYKSFLRELPLPQQLVLLLICKKNFTG